MISLPPSVCLGPSNALGNVPATALPAAQFADWCRQAMSSRENQSQKPRLLLQLADVVNSSSNIQNRVKKRKLTLIRTCYKLNPERINIECLLQIMMNHEIGFKHVFATSYPPTCSTKSGGARSHHSAGIFHAPGHCLSLFHLAYVSIEKKIDLHT